MLPVKNILNKLYNSYKYKKVFLALIILFSVSIYISATSYIKNKEIEKVEIKIKKQGNYSMISEDYIKDLLQIDLNIIGTKLKFIDLQRIENTLDNDAYIKNSDVYINNDKLIIKVFLREPVIRIFYNKSKSYFFDIEGKILPNSNLISPNVPVLITKFPIKQDTTLNLLWIYTKPFVNYIHNDDFWYSFISTVEINKDSTITLSPVVGDYEIVFGKINPTELDVKFKILKTFFREVLNKQGWKHYKRIRLDINNQIVAEKY